MIAPLGGGAALVPGSTAGADSFTPVRMQATVAPVARLDRPLAVTVAVSADAGVLDDRTAPLQVAAKLAGECGGTYQDTPGAVLLDAQLSPQPATGQPDQASASGRATPQGYGTFTVCVFLQEEGDDRQLATETDTQVDVSRSCTSTADAFDRDRDALAGTRAQLAHARGARRRRLWRLATRRRRATITAQRAAAHACGPGVSL
ncbi:MAG TPA: hypothetical protein VHX88_02945 [Solirubrobacteraceae bacterium]|nr:hypothetical protein [Solirubrobacteraceae bacterium]